MILDFGFWISGLFSRIQNKFVLPLVKNLSFNQSFDYKKESHRKQTCDANVIRLIFCAGRRCSNANGVQGNGNGVRSNASGIRSNANGVRSNALRQRINALRMRSNALRMRFNTLRRHSNAMRLRSNTFRLRSNALRVGFNVFEMVLIIQYSIADSFS